MNIPGGGSVAGMAAAAAAAGAVAGAGGGAPQAAQPMQQVDREKMYQWIIELASPDTRENALLELRLVCCSFPCV